MSFPRPSHGVGNLWTHPTFKTMKRSWIPWFALGAFLLAAWMAAWTIFAVLLWERYSSISYSSSDPQDYHIRFGILGTDSSGNDVLAKETTTIPLRFKDSGFRYGLEIVSPHNDSFVYQCVFRYAARPKLLTGEWESDQPSSILKTPKVQAKGSAIEEYWFDPGDPVGEQSVDIFVNDQLVKTIKYTVVAEN